MLKVLLRELRSCDEIVVWLKRRLEVLAWDLLERVRVEWNVVYWRLFHNVLIGNEVGRLWLIEAKWLWLVEVERWWLIEVGCLWLIEV